MPQILIVEGNKKFARIASKRIASELHYDSKIASTYKEARKLVEKEDANFFVAISDLILPDAPNGEIIDFVLSKNIPVIVLTETYSEDIRERISSKKVVDYIVKKSLHDFDYAVRLIRRIHSNQYIKVLVVDDSPTARQLIKRLLEIQKFIVFEAVDGEKALEILNSNTDIKLVITDFSMPKMDGFELISRIRKDYSKDRLAIIGLSTYGNSALSAKFLKIGANDFLTKPFLNEEFHCRVTQNIEIVEQIQAIKDSSNRDYLTDLYNRKYFFEVGEKFYKNARRGNIALVVAMIDIDFFKKVNDTYGHTIGDIALKQLSSLLVENLRKSDIVARFGGEEFCVLATNMNKKSALLVFEKIRELVERSEIRIKDKTVKLTISIGIATRLNDSLEEMIKHADMMLYKAKEDGRNMVVIEL